MPRSLEIDLGALPFGDTHTLVGSSDRQEQTAPHWSFSEDAPFCLNASIVVAFAFLLWSLHNWAQKDLAEGENKDQPPDQP